MGQFFESHAVTKHTDTAELNAHQNFIIKCMNIDGARCVYPTIYSVFFLRF